MGPTAAGKSAVALELAHALDGEIVSVDSAQVYRGMDIGTAKPDASTRAGVVHHLIDICDPVDAYSAARFVRDACTAIDAIRQRGRMPILAGGTMLYFKALTEGLSDLPAADASVRSALDAEARARGWTALHADLARVDPATAKRLAPGDAQRIQRALEVWRMTGEPLSALQGRRRVPPIGHTLTLALVPVDRAALHQAIARRFEAMLKAGLVNELEALRRDHPLTADMPSMRSVGYRQAWAHLDGALDHAQLRSAGIAATRQLAKRQLTWLRRGSAKCFDPFAGDTAGEVLAFVERELRA